MRARGYITGNMCVLLVFSKSANAAMLGQDIVTSVILIIALATLDNLGLWFKNGQGSSSSEYL
jgi:hypothetical protein